MRLLVDTHALLWWLTEDPRLRPPERDAISDGESLVHVSAATLWEISIKAKLGRIDVDQKALSEELEQNAFIELPITWRHGTTAGALERHHDDPFDRMLIAQAREEKLVLLSYDPAFRVYEVELLPSKDS